MVVYFANSTFILVLKLQVKLFSVVT